MLCNKVLIRTNSDKLAITAAISTIIFMFFNIGMNVRYDANVNIVCNESNIPKEFQKFQCKLIEIEIDFDSNDSLYSVGILGACNDINKFEYTIKITDFKWNTISFPCYFNTTYCGSESTDSNQLTTEYDEIIMKYNECLKDRKTKIEQIQGIWISLNIIGVIILPMFILLIVTLIWNMVMDIRFWCDSHNLESTDSLESYDESDKNISTDDFESATSSCEPDNRCLICSDKMKENKCVLLHCCNTVVHTDCFFKFKEFHSNLDCINPYCKQKSVFIDHIYTFDQSDPCPVCLTSLNENILLYTGCCKRTIHQYCYMTINSEHECKLCKN